MGKLLDHFGTSERSSGVSSVIFDKWKADEVVVISGEVIITLSAAVHL